MSELMGLEFRASSIYEQESFPVVYFACDTDLTLRFKIFVTDVQRAGGLTIDNIKTILSQVVDIDDWEVDDDRSCKCLELYGIKNLKRQDESDDFRPF